jgi:hypothetical protein
VHSCRVNTEISNVHQELNAREISYFELAGAAGAPGALPGI